MPAKSSNTSNLLTHLRDHHPDLHAEAIPHSSHTAKATKRQPTLHEVVTVENPGFRHLIHTLDPKYNLLSRKYFTKQEIPRLYTEIKEMVKSKMNGAKYFAATTDLWTSCNNHPYLSFTVHFIDDDWLLQSFCLDTVPLFEDHTEQNRAEAIDNMLENWGLSKE